jgi:hypothetical protein
MFKSRIDMAVLRIINVPTDAIGKINTVNFQLSIIMWGMECASFMNMLVASETLTEPCTVLNMEWKMTKLCTLQIDGWNILDVL